MPDKSPSAIYLTLGSRGILQQGQSEIYTPTLSNPDQREKIRVKKCPIAHWN